MGRPDIPDTVALDRIALALAQSACETCRVDDDDTLRVARLAAVMGMEAAMRIATAQGIDR